MNRRNFMSSILALGAAPAIVRAESIMRIKPIVLPGEAEFEAVVLGNQFATIDQVARESLAILRGLLIIEEEWYMSGIPSCKARRIRGRA